MKDQDQDLARGRTKAMPVDSLTAAENEASVRTVPSVSYDERQKQAPLLMCVACGRWYNVTLPHGWLRCAVCSK